MNIYGHNFLKMYSSIVRLNISSSHKHLWTFLEHFFLNCEIGNFFLPQTFGHNFLKIYSSIVRLNISSSHKHLWTQFPGNVFLYCNIEYFLLPQTFMAHKHLWTQFPDNSHIVRLNKFPGKLFPV